MTEAGTPRTERVRRTPRWLLVALLASLALNLIIVGSVAGAMWRFRKPPPWASAVTPNLLGYASTLPARAPQAAVGYDGRGAQAHPPLPPRGARRARGDDQGPRRRAVR